MGAQRNISSPIENKDQNDRQLLNGALKAATVQVERLVKAPARQLRLTLRQNERRIMDKNK